MSRRPTQKAIVACYLDHEITYRLQRPERAAKKLDDYKAVVVEYLPEGKWKSNVYYVELERIEEALKVGNSFVHRLQKYNFNLYVRVPVVAVLVGQLEDLIPYQAMLNTARLFDRNETIYYLGSKKLKNHHEHQVMHRPLEYLSPSDIKITARGSFVVSQAALPHLVVVTSLLGLWESENPSGHSLDGLGNVIATTIEDDYDRCLAQTIEKIDSWLSQGTSPVVIFSSYELNRPTGYELNRSTGYELNRPTGYDFQAVRFAARLYDWCLSQDYACALSYDIYSRLDSKQQGLFSDRSLDNQMVAVLRRPAKDLPHEAPTVCPSIEVPEPSADKALLGLLSDVKTLLEGQGTSKAWFKSLPRTLLNVPY